jgi:hypothetical protein
VERSLKRRAVVPRPPLTEDAAMIALERILIPTDFSEPSDVALTYGLELARAFRATAIVIHVVKDRFTAGLHWVGTRRLLGPIRASQVMKASIAVGAIASGARRGRLLALTGGCP